MPVFRRFRQRHYRYRTRTRPSRQGLRAVAGVGLIALTLLITGSRTPTALEEVLAAGTLTIISRNGPTNYYQGPNGMAGFEYALAKSFADELGVELAINDIENLSTMLKNVGGQAGQFAAAGLSVTEERTHKVRFTEPYMEVTQQLLFNVAEPRPRSVEDLIGKNIMVIANSSHAERLRELQHEHPELRWSEQNDLEMLDLMEMVHNGVVDYAVVDSNAYQMNRTLFPLAQPAFAIAEPEPVAWAFPNNADPSLYEMANRFLRRAQDNGTLALLKDRYYGHTNEINHGGARLFAHRIQTRLPKYLDWIKEAAEDYGIDWHLLAAIGYQESHWNHRAVSPTGVRGFMMLTRNTARDLGIANRTDPLQSIRGGAKYFAQIHSRIPAHITEPDRTWMALAAYNVGPGHLEDARILTERFGGDPNLWVDVREHLPLLQKRKYYRQTKYGYARGMEPVRYVQHIRNFYQILAWNTLMEERGNQGTLPANHPEGLDLSLSPL